MVGKTAQVVVMAVIVAVAVAMVAAMVMVMAALEQEQEQEQVDLVREYLEKCTSSLTICSVWKRIGHDPYLRRSCWPADGRR